MTTDAQHINIHALYIYRDLSEPLSGVSVEEYLISTTDFAQLGYVLNC